MDEKDHGHGPPATGGTGADAPDPAAGAEAGTDGMVERIHSALRGVFDPEIPVNIYDLGLIYDVHVAPGGRVDIKMTLTAPGCPVAGTMPGMVEQAVAVVDGVTEVAVELVWDPPWTPDRMSEAARLELGFM